ncbi:hypothetical protein MHYP_G00232870 [Metynnis hypsauchen]
MWGSYAIIGTGMKGHPNAPRASNTQQKSDDGSCPAIAHIITRLCLTPVRSKRCLKCEVVHPVPARLEHQLAKTTLGFRASHRLLMELLMTLIAPERGRRGVVEGQPEGDTVVIMMTEEDRGGAEREKDMMRDAVRQEENERERECE